MIVLRRRTDWPARLTAFFNATRGEPYRLSTMDCAVWPLRAVDAMCATAHAEAFRDQYDSPESAMAYVTSRGWTCARDALIEFGCRPLTSPLFAQRGDIAVLPADPPLVLALQVGGTFYMPEPSGEWRALTLQVASRLGAEAFAVGR
jgi:hypothetical protein